VPHTTSKAFQAQERRQPTKLADCYSRIEMIISEFRQICWQKQAFFLDVHSLDRFVNIEQIHIVEKYLQFRKFSHNLNIELQCYSIFKILLAPPCVKLTLPSDDLLFTVLQLLALNADEDF